MHRKFGTVFVLVEEEYAQYFWSFIGNWNMVRDNRYQFCRKTTEYFMEMRDNNGLNKYMKTFSGLECSFIEIDDDDLELENFAFLCDEDFYLWWLLMQLFVVTLALVTFFILCLVHFTRIHSLQYYVYAIKQIKFLKPPTPPPSYLEMLKNLKNCGNPKCQMAKVCKCRKKYTPKPPKKSKVEKKSIKAAMELNDQEYATGQTCYRAD